MGDIIAANENKISDTSIKTIIKDLLAKERRAHIVTILIAAPTLYLSGQSNLISPRIGAFAFISLAIGYSAFALLALSEKTRKVTQIKQSKKVSNSDLVSRKIIYKFISSTKIIIIPLSISLLVFVIFYILMSENKPLSSIGTILPVALASLFVFWSVSQAVTYKLSVGMWVHNKFEVNDIINDFDIKKNSIIQLIIVGFCSCLISYLMLIFYGENQDFEGIIGVLIVSTTTMLFHSLNLWYSRENRSLLMNRKDGAKVEFLWGILLHIFASWHFLSFYRRIISSNSMAFNLLEEVILMVSTVIISIWSISTKGVKKNISYFIPENILFWGIAFGFGYAGSVTMLAVGLEGDITIIFALGHLVTWLTLLLLFKQSCRDLLTLRL